ncbi:MAG TPA: phospholipase A [Tepidisphaeraceae bacterium]
MNKRNNLWRAALALLGTFWVADRARGQIAPTVWGESDSKLIYIYEQPEKSDDSTRPGLDPGSSGATTMGSMPPQFAATQPESASAVAGHFPSIGGSFGLEEFAQHFAPYEPMYFVGGWRAPQIKFQFSIRYRLLTPSGPIATKYPLLSGFNFAYSQTSFWDWSDPNSPFFYDSSYRPEFFYYLENVPKLALPPGWQLGAQVGVGHESNGKRNPDHRSLNIAFVRPIFTIAENAHGLFFTFAPKIYYYIGDIALNPDIKRFRGYVDIRFVIGQRDGLQLATIGRVGDHFDRGSAQFDLTYPLTTLLHGNADLCIDAQYFIGYGDSLLSYNRRSQVFRVGFALVR